MGDLHLKPAQITSQPLKTSVPPVALVSLPPSLTGAVATPKPAANTPDTANLAPLSEAQTHIPFVGAELPEPSFETRLSEIQKLSSASEKAEQFEALFEELIDEGQFSQAHTLVLSLKQNPQLQARLYDPLIHEMLEAGKYNQALELNQAFPNAALQSKNMTYIVRYLVEQGETIAAAQASGQGDLSGIIKAEWQSAMHTLEQKYDTLLDSIKDLFRKESLAEKIAEEALSDVGKQYRQKYLGYGNLACAHTVSRVFDNFPELTSVDANEVNDLVRQMKSKGGFTQVAGQASRPRSPVPSNTEYKPGDVVTFARGKKQGYGHVGVISRIREDGTVMMVHNSSSRKQVVEIPLVRYTTPTGVFRLGE